MAGGDPKKDCYCGNGGPCLGAEFLDADFRCTRHAALIEEIVQLREDLALAQRAIAAQDEREAAAGARCGVARELFGCDWPDAAAERIIALREALALHTAQALERAEADAGKARRPKPPL